MATTEHFRDGGGTTFPFVFPILANSDLKVEVYNATTGLWELKTENTSGQTDNDYRIENTNVVFNSATPSGTGNIHTYRQTNVDNPAAVFAAGSSIRAVDLNDNQTQVLYSTQEAADQVVREDDLGLASVTSAKIANFTIVNDDINASAAIAGTKVTPSFGSQNISTTGTATTGTATTGALTVNGAITVATTVDGRDVAADGTKLDTIETNAKDDQTAAEIKTLLQSNKLTDSEIATGTLDNRYYTETELLNGALDGRYFTETEADARYYNLASAEEIQSGETWTAADNKVATTAAIDARIIDLVDDIGGFVPIANETSFPNANPDVNNGAGTLVSVPLANNLTSNGSGVITIANGTVGNSTVTITGATASSTFAQGFGIIVETTSTLNTYTFHRYVPKATEVTTVATNLTNINKVAVIDANVTKVANIDSNVTSVANIDSQVTTVANNNGNVSNVGNQITNVANVGNSIGNVNTVAGSIGNVNTVAGISSNVTSVAGVASNVPTVAGISGNVTTVAGISSNVSTVAGISGNVTTVAGISGDVTAAASNDTDISTVAGSITNVNNVGGAISDVASIANSLSNVNTVAGDIANVNTVAGNNANINTVAGNNSNITTVANNNSNITAVAQDATDIGAVAGSIANVNTTAANIANVNSVGGNISNVNTVATNLTPINTAATYLNNFQALYLGAASSAPVNDGVGGAVTEGDLYFNSGNKQLQVFNGSVFTSIFDTALDFAKSATAAFNALYTASAGSNSIDLGGLAITGAAFSNEAVATNRVSLTKGSATYNLGGI